MNSELRRRLPAFRQAGIRRWLFPSWRRFWVLSGSLSALYALAWATRPYWLAPAVEWEFWATVGRQPATARGVPGFMADPLSFELPIKLRLLEDGRWATPRAREIALILRRHYPQEAATWDYYLACWEFWSGDPHTAREQFQRLGEPLDPALFALRIHDLAALPKLAEDLSVDGASRARASYALAQEADRTSNSPAAAVYYLKTLENCATGPDVATLRAEVWELVRARLGRGITRAQYAASLRALGLRTTDQAVLEEIVFELGKLDLLQPVPNEASQ